MKDYRLQGQLPSELGELIRRHPASYKLESRLWCWHCNTQAAWFHCYLDMLVCIDCLARHMVTLPKRFEGNWTSRIRCECGDFRRAIFPKKMSCKRCGKVERWNDPLVIQPLFEVVVKLEAKPEFLTGDKLRKVLEEGLDA